MRWLSVQDDGDIYSPRSVVATVMGVLLVHAHPLEVRRFENHASCTGYLDGQANGLSF
jgi:hypothetical protein